MDQDKKRKRQYYQNSQKRRRQTLEVGLKGFFCSFNGRQEDCLKESYSILNEYADKLYPAENVESDKEKDNIDNLYEEIQLMKTGKHRFQVVDSGANHIMLIRTTIEDPLKLAEAIVHDIHNKKEQKTRFLIRLVPIETTCKAYIDDILKTFEPLLEKYFCEETTFSIVYNHRNNNSLSKDEVISAVADVIIKKNQKHKVDLNSAKMSVIIEVIKSFVLLSVIPNFLQLKKYNLHALCKKDSVEIE